MKKKTPKTVSLQFAKTEQNGKCVELLLTDKEVSAGLKRASDPQNNKWLSGQKRCEIVSTPKIAIEIPAQLSIWERFQKLIGI